MVRHRIPREDPVLQSPAYTPSRLLNEVADRLGARNDADVARRLELDPALVSRARRRAAPITANMKVAIMEATGMTVRELNRLAGLSTCVLLNLHVPTPAGYFRRVQAADGDVSYFQVKGDIVARDVVAMYEEPVSVHDMREELAKAQRENLELSERLAEIAQAERAKGRAL